MLVPVLALRGRHGCGISPAFCRSVSNRHIGAAHGTIDHRCRGTSPTTLAQPREGARHRRKRRSSAGAPAGAVRPTGEMTPLGAVSQG